jgi:hypothetical protein
MNTVCFIAIGSGLGLILGILLIITMPQGVGRP